MAKRCNVCKKTYPDDKKKCPHCGAKAGAPVHEDDELDLELDESHDDVVVLADEDEEPARPARKPAKGKAHEEDIVELADDADEAAPVEPHEGHEDDVVVLADDAEESPSGVDVVEEAEEDIVVVDEDEPPAQPSKKKTHLAPQGRPATMLARDDDEEAAVAPPVPKPSKKTQLAPPGRPATMLAKSDEPEEPVEPAARSSKKTQLAPTTKPMTQLAPPEAEVDEEVAEVPVDDSQKKTKLSPPSKPATMLASPEDLAALADEDAAPAAEAEHAEAEDVADIGDSGVLVSDSEVNLGARPKGTSISGVSALDAGEAEEAPAEATSDVLAQSLLEEDDEAARRHDDSSAVDLGSHFDDMPSSGVAVEEAEAKSTSGLDLGGLEAAAGSGVQIGDEEAAEAEGEAAEEEAEAEEEKPARKEKKRGRAMPVVGGGVLGALVGAGACAGLWYAGIWLPPEWRGDKPASAAVKPANTNVQSPPAVQETPMQMAQKAIDQGKFEDAARTLKAAPVPTDPKQKADTLVERAKATWFAYLQAHGDNPKPTDPDVQQAQKDLTEARAVAPGNVDGIYWLGQIQEDTGQTALAHDTFAEGLKLVDDANQKRRLQAALDRIDSKLTEEEMAGGDNPPEKPAPKKPAAEEPEEKPAPKKSADKKPAAEEPEEKPAPKKSADKKPAAEEPEEKPAPKKPADKKPAAEEPEEKAAPKKPADKKPAAEEPEEKPAPRKPAEKKPAADEPDEKPAPAKPAPKKPAAEQPEEDKKPSSDKPADKKPEAKKPADDQPSNEEKKPADDKPAKPAKPADKKPAPAAPSDTGKEARSLVPESGIEPYGLLLGLVPAQAAGQPATDQPKAPDAGQPKAPAGPAGAAPLPGGEQPKAAPEPEEAGYKFWEALRLAKENKYDEALAALAEARKAHERRRYLRIGRAQNPQSDPTGQVFLRSVDELQTYWKMRSELVKAGYLGDETKVFNPLKALTNLEAAKKNADAVVQTVKDKLKQDRDIAKADPELMDVGKDLDLLMASRKKIDDQLTALQKTLEDAKYLSEEKKNALDGLKKLIKDKDQATETLAATADLLKPDKYVADKDPNVPEGVKKLLTDKTADDEKVTDLTAKLKTADGTLSEVAHKLAGAKYLPPGAPPKEIPKGVERVIDEASSPVVRAVSRGVGELSGLADNLVSGTVQAADLGTRLGLTEEQLVRYRVLLMQARTPHQMLDIWVPLLQEDRGRKDLCESAALDADRIAKDKGASPEIKAEARAVAGLALRNQGRLVEARKTLQEALAAPGTPRDGDWRVQAGQALKELTDPAVYYLPQADRLRAAGKQQEALAVLTNGLKAFPPDAKDGGRLLAMRSVVNLDLAEAQAKGTKRSAADPGVVAATKDADAAVTAGATVEGEYARGLIAETLGDWAGAKQSYRKAHQAHAGTDANGNLYRVALARALVKDYENRPRVEARPADDGGPIEPTPPVAKPEEKKPAEKKPVEEPEEKPADKKPVEKKPAEEPEEKPAEKKPAEKKPVEKKPAEELEEKPAEKKPAAKKPLEKKPAEEPAEEKPADKKPAAKKPAEETPDEEKPADKKPAKEKPADESPDDKKPEAGKPGKEKPADKKPADDGTDEKPADKKPAAEKPGKEARRPSLSTDRLAAMTVLLLTALVDEEPVVKKTPADLAEAERLADEAIRAGDPEGHLIKARVLAQKGEWADVLNEYLEGMQKLSRDPERVKALRMLVENHPAFRMPEGLKAPEPLLAEKHFATGLRLYYDRNYIAAEKQFFQAAHYNDQDARFFYFLGLARLSQEKRDDAYEAFKRGGELEIQSKPNSASVSVTLERVQGPQRQLLDRFRP